MNILILEALILILTILGSNVDMSRDNRVSCLDLKIRLSDILEEKRKK